ncbi:hypothetical protein [Falsiroseomonas sp. HW251]|uniref:hypothetical protein n=1 Tax=Falsiroseomonas sp. HW251 TaxID=3390998 RepID=UPI003D318869
MESPSLATLTEELIEIEIEAASEAAAAAVEARWWNQAATLLLVLGGGSLCMFWVVAIMPDRPLAALVPLGILSAVVVVAWAGAKPAEAAAEARRLHLGWADLARLSGRQRRAAARDVSAMQVQAGLAVIRQQRDALREGRRVGAAGFPAFDGTPAEAAPS